MVGARVRTSQPPPIRSGAESFLAGTASCRIETASCTRVCRWPNSDRLRHTRVRNARPRRQSADVLPLAALAAGEQAFAISVRFKRHDGPVNRSELQQSVEAGMTVREIASTTGKAYSTVRYWLNKHGLATLSRGPGRASRREAGERICLRHGRVPFINDSHGTRC